MFVLLVTSVLVLSEQAWANHFSAVFETKYGVLTVRDEHFTLRSKTKQLASAPDYVHLRADEKVVMVGYSDEVILLSLPSLETLGRLRCVAACFTGTEIVAWGSSRSGVKGFEVQWRKFPVGATFIAAKDGSVTYTVDAGNSVTSLYLHHAGHVYHTYINWPSDRLGARGSMIVSGRSGPAVLVADGAAGRQLGQLWMPPDALESGPSSTHCVNLWKVNGDVGAVWYEGGDKRGFFVSLNVQEDNRLPLLDGIVDMWPGSGGWYGLRRLHGVDMLVRGPFRSLLSGERMVIERSDGLERDERVSSDTTQGWAKSASR